MSYYDDENRYRPRDDEDEVECECEFPLLTVLVIGSLILSLAVYGLYTAFLQLF